MKKMDGKFKISLLFLAVILIIPVIGPHLIRHDPYAVNVRNAFLSPCKEYLFGTDNLGRCVFCRILAGSRTSIYTALLIVGIVFLVGTLVGILAGFAGGVLDEILMKITLVFQAFPAFVLSIAIAGILGVGLWNGVLITASLLLEKTFLRWKAALHVNDKSAGWRVFMTLRTALLVFIGRYFTRAPRLRSVFTLLKTTVLYPQPGQLFDGTLLSLGLAKTDFLVIALGLIVLLVLESLQERGVQIRAGLEKKSGFVQWAAMTALLLAVFLLGVFRAGYIPSGFIYTQF